MLFDLLPNDLGEINQDTLDDFVRHLRGLPSEAIQSFLVNRVRRGLEHFRVRKIAPEMAIVLSSQSDIDANSVESSYTILKVFIWAIPIMGFIGTVLGISAAVGQFSGSLDAASDVTKLKESLGGVTGGLATAFDTTLVALVMSILVMFPSSSMRKSEEDLLNWVDEYCNENLLKRPSGSGVGLKPVFVECTATSAVIHEGDEPHRVSTGALRTDEKFLAMLDRVAKTDDTPVVFLIRDDAISTYRVASAVAKSHYARNGKIPVIGHGKLDLSLFK